MKVLRAIGAFFARIGRWIKETAWIQPLLIVGAIFAIIFAIPHIIDGVKGWFDESDAANKYFTKYQLTLTGADVIPDGKYVGKSKVDDLFTYIADGDEEKVKSISKSDKFFLAFVEKDSSACKDLYAGFKAFQDKFNKNDEFKDLEGNFKLLTIYTDSISKVDDETNLFDKVWSNHYELFEDLATENYLANTPYAINNNYNTEKYASTFVGSSQDSSCPMTSPLVMFFDFTEDNLIKNQTVKGLSDVIFSLSGSSELENARLLRDCWSHKDVFLEVKNH